MKKLIIKVFRFFRRDKDIRSNRRTSRETLLIRNMHRQLDEIGVPYPTGDISEADAISKRLKLLEQSNNDMNKNYGISAGIEGKLKRLY